MEITGKETADQLLPVGHHWHADHQTTEFTIKDWRAVFSAFLDESNVEFDPIPLVEKALVVQFKGFIVRDAQTVVDKLPCREVVDEDTVHV